MNRAEGFHDEVYAVLDNKKPITEYLIFSRWKDNKEICEINKFLSNATLSQVDRYVSWLNKTDILCTYKRENPAKYTKLVAEFEEGLE
jgi:hypothetical protein